MPDLSHFDDHGSSRMVDVGGKTTTARMARATGQIRMRPETLQLIRDREISKGDVLGVARLAGIMAAKRTDELIPLCHSLPLTSVELVFGFPTVERLQIEATVRTQARTGVEMEALMAVSIAALTVYDMCKSVDRHMVLEQLRLEEKWGGVSGHFERSGSDNP
jgi:cyclic pyranopterin phosphate synthase